jgi:MraZ protein
VAFRGQYDYSLDAKNRLNIPPKFRAAFSEGLVLSKDPDPCIAIYTPEAFERQIEDALAAVNRLSGAHRKVTRFLSHNSWEEKLDASGRVTVNAKLLDHAGITKAVVIAGTNDRVEVWDPERWLEMQEQVAAEMPEIAEGLGHTA